MIWFILALIVALVVLIKNKKFGEFLFTLGVGCAVAFGVGMVIREVIPDQYEVIREEKLVLLQKEDSYVTIMNIDASSGWSNKPTMVFTVIGKDDAIVTYRTSVTSDFNENSITIIETNVIEPKYVRQKMRPMYESWEWFTINFSPSRYILYVPEGGIEYDYNVK